jgi:predicted  nucleic acid-binding Zn-ribbon protein
LQKQLELLKTLQRIDSDISSIEHNRATYPNKIKQLDEELERKNQRAEKDKAQLEEVQKQRVSKEQSLRLEGERLKNAQDRLLSVKTNKEYQAALKEIEDIKVLCNDLETEILVIMEKTDALTREIKSQEIEDKEWKQGFEKQKEVLQAEIQKSDLELETQKSMRVETFKDVEPSLLKKYDTLVQKRQGLAVVAIEDGHCQGCNMHIPPQKILELRRNRDSAIMSCPFCNRMLYFDEEPVEGD